MRASNEGCRACGSDNQKSPKHIPDFEYAIPSGADYCECPSCGSFTQTPMPDGQALSSFYPASYHSFLPASSISRYRQGARIRELERVSGASLEGKVILDFGCGQGMFLDALAAQFPNGKFYGYEIGAENVRETRHDGRVTIFRGDLDFFWNELPKIDIVTLNHVIEHLPIPYETVAKIFDALAPGGGIEGQTPNSDCYERQLFGDRWSGFHSPRHTVVFSAKGLEKLLKDVGFKEVHVSSGFNPATWAVSLGSLMQNKEAPTGIRRSGLGWLSLVLTAIPFTWIESKTNRAAVSDFWGVKR